MEIELYMRDPILTKCWNAGEWNVEKAARKRDIAARRKFERARALRQSRRRKLTFTMAIYLQKKTESRQISTGYLRQKPCSRRGFHFKLPV